MSWLAGSRSVCNGSTSSSKSRIGRKSFEPSPTNPAQKKSRVWVTRRETADQLYVLCRSEGRQAKDRAIRDKQETRLLADLSRLQKLVAKQRIDEAKIHETIGRLKERYPRVARDYQIRFDSDLWQLGWQEKAEAKARAVLLDGVYLLRPIARISTPKRLGVSTSC